MAICDKCGDKGIVSTSDIGSRDVAQPCPDCWGVSLTAKTVDASEMRALEAENRLLRGQVGRSVTNYELRQIEAAEDFANA